MIDVSDLVFTRCKVALVKEFGNISVNSRSTFAPSEFPAAGISQIGAPTTGGSFDNQQNACISTIEVQAYSIESSEEARHIIEVVADTMNTMHYAMTYGVSELPTEENLIRYVARFRRTIGAGDSL